MASFRPFRASDHYGVPKPRASLRFALGYHLAPRWGFVPVGLESLNEHSRPRCIGSLFDLERPNIVSYAPTGRHEIAQGRAKRHPGCVWVRGIWRRNGSVVFDVALGYHLAPRWGFVPIDDYSSANRRPSDFMKLTV